MIKEVTDVYGRKVKIETDGQKVYSYNNKEHRVQYNAKWVDSASGFSWTDYIEDGTVEDLETRISVFGSRFGDYRKDFLISEDEIREMVKIREGR